MSAGAAKGGRQKKNAANVVESADGSAAMVRKKKEPESAQPKFLSRQKFIQPSGGQPVATIILHSKQIFGTTWMNENEFRSVPQQNWLTWIKSQREGDLGTFQADTQLGLAGN